MPGTITHSLPRDAYENLLNSLTDKLIPDIFVVQNNKPNESQIGHGQPKLKHAVKQSVGVAAPAVVRRLRLLLQAVVGHAEKLDENVRVDDVTLGAAAARFRQLLPADYPQVKNFRRDARDNVVLPRAKVRHLQKGRGKGQIELCVDGSGN